MRAVRAVARVTRTLAYVAAAAAVLLAVALSDDGWLVAVALAAVVPAVVLFLFSQALREVIDLPPRLRAAPADAAELRTALSGVAGARGSGLFRPLWRAGRAAMGARELVTPWAPLLPLLSLPFLLATLACALATPALLLVSLVVLVVYT